MCAHGRELNRVETGFPHVILASLDLAMLDQSGHEFTGICQLLPPKGRD